MDTDAFASVEANQSPEVDAATDDNALLGINTAQVRAPPHKIELTNNTQSGFTITIESKNDKFTFTPSTVENLSPGDIAKISISSDTPRTGRVTEEIVIKCDFAQKSGIIDIFRQLTIDVPEEDDEEEDDEDDEDEDDEDDEDEDDEDEDDEDEDDEDDEDEDDEDEDGDNEDQNDDDDDD